MAIVVDVSALVSLAFADEDRVYPEIVLRRIVEEGAVVPALFWYEIHNTLIVGERRKRIPADQVNAFIQELRRLPIETEPDVGPDAITLARDYGLTFYDAAYLEIAQFRQIELATLDNALRNAAEKVGVPIVGTI